MRTPWRHVSLKSTPGGSFKKNDFFCHVKSTKGRVHTMVAWHHRGGGTVSTTVVEVVLTVLTTCPCIYRR